MKVILSDELKLFRVNTDVIIAKNAEKAGRLYAENCVLEFKDIIFFYVDDYVICYILKLYDECGQEEKIENLYCYGEIKEGVY